jgi:hypothetical protein
MTTTLESKPREVISYHPDNIKRLIEERDILQNKIKNRHDKIDLYQNAVDALTQQVEALQENRFAIRKQIALREQQIQEALQKTDKLQQDKKLDIAGLIKAPIALVTRPVKFLLDQLEAGLVDELSLQIRSAIKEFTDPVLTELEMEKEELFDERINKRARAMQLLQRHIGKEKNDINEMLVRVRQIQHYKDDAERNFMPALRQTPGDLCQKIKNILSKLKIEHEDKYVGNQSDSIEICLFELEERVNLILSDKTTDIKNQQKQYLELCGFLWRMYDSLVELKKQSNGEKELAEKIFYILQEMHLNKHDDLPNEMATGKKALELYTTQHGDLGVSTLKEVQIKEYDKAKDQLERALIDSPLMTQDIRAISQKLIQQVEIQKETDVRFCTTILKTTKKLMTPGEDTPQVFERYMDLAHKASGKPSAWKKIAGFMLGLAGAALIGLSLFAGFASVGLAAPISLLGLQFGAGLAMAGYAYMTGLATFGLGEYLFLGGTRRGLSESIVKCGNTIRSRTPTPGLFKAVAPVQPLPSASVPLKYVEITDERPVTVLVEPTAPPPAYAG